jgi:two-component system sensor histidine kinase AlgZ
MSIRQNPQATRLPDFGNLGVMLRILLAVNLLAFGAALARNGELGLLPRELVELAALVEPPLIAAVLLLYAANRSLARLPYAAAVTAIGVAGAVLAALFQALLARPACPWPACRAPRCGARSWRRRSLPTSICATVPIRRPWPRRA